ncbi:hypothetical protein T459_04833 [Capsicum annuum]|uniref:Reverse transcriptase domain-containing protein n=1 Tax=Capsicum annuum TaxID=4072 RepID=A0A2G3A6A3_CAPAN|nr:hypothetical protein T459_04833 [Capsicum annuum]
MDDFLYGSIVQEAKVRDFKDFIQEIGLVELKSIRRKYTWSNNHILSRINWMFVNSTWMQLYPHLEGMIMDSLFSDQSPLSVTLAKLVGERTKSFKFYNYHSDHPEFQKLVPGFGMQAIWNKLKQTKQGIKSLVTADYQGVEDKVRTARTELKSRVTWLRLGEANTKYFHACLRSRQSQNQIRRLISLEGHAISTAQEIENEMVHFYKELLGTSAQKLPMVNVDVMAYGPSLDRAQQLELIKLVTKDEVYEALQSINDNKAPGSDGFNAHLFKKAWRTIEHEITNAVLDFFNLVECALL